MLASMLLLMAAEGAVAVPAVEIAEPNPREMSRAEILKFNAQLPPSHPYFIRCVKTLEIGSLVKKTYSCRTNAKWEAADEAGNQNARELGEHFKPKFMTNE